MVRGMDRSSAWLGDPYGWSGWLGKVMREVRIKKPRKLIICRNDELNCADFITFFGTWVKNSEVCIWKRRRGLVWMFVQSWVKQWIKLLWLVNWRTRNFKWGIWKMKSGNWTISYDGNQIRHNRIDNCNKLTCCSVSSSSSALVCAVILMCCDVSLSLFFCQSLYFCFGVCFLCGAAFRVTESLNCQLGLG